jgi:DNA (cytosine-5)-methyltransferase 1
MLKVISLFSGAGGSDLGMQQAGLETVFAVDSDDIANQTFHANLGLKPWGVPVQYLKTNMLPECDIIIGGPPCQSFSNARSRYGAYSCVGLTNVVEMQRIVKEKQPKLFVCENVPVLYTKEHMHYVFIKFLEGFKNAGYHVDCHLINAIHCGVPQDRTRLFLFGIRNDLFKQQIYIKKPPTDHWSKHCTGWANYLGIKTNGLYFASFHKNAACRQPNEAAPTLTTLDKPIVIENWKKLGKLFERKWCEMNGIMVRDITIAQCARLQGFPATYKFCGTQNEQLKQIGNAWCVAVGKAIGLQLRLALND